MSTKYFERLRLQIACRTIDWPASLEKVLRSVWPDDQVKVVQLVPLRRSDVASAADQAQVDLTRFLDAITVNDFVPFAVTPVTLQFLLDELKWTNRLPD